MHQYPFTAIVGQEKLKQALLLCAINPAIGGVLIKGEKGTAKSTAARGLSAVMPTVQRIANSLFNTSEDEFLLENQLGKPDFNLETISVPFVDLPLGASEDRVLGSLDLEAMVSEKKKRFLPGLLAGAHRGILYIDEVNLLADHLVDILLDVSASGVNTVQREGLSMSHPSRFVLIGTMNPEEGNLRPQFLDRFGLMVEVDAQSDIKERTEVVRRRMVFEANPGVFGKQWQASQDALQEKIRGAQNLLPTVEMPDGLLTLISQLCVEWSIASLRADIVMYKTAITIAALAGRKTANAEDVKQAAALVLNHRKGKQPFKQNHQSQTPASNPTSDTPQERSGETDNPTTGIQKESTDPGDECGEGDCPPEGNDSVFGIENEKEVPVLKSEFPVSAPELINGKRSKAADTVKGFQVRAEKSVFAKEIAISETLTHAILRNPDDIQIRKEDIHQKIRAGKTGHLILFVVDASGSMASGKRMEAVKGSVLSLLKDAYQKRDMVGVISFRGVEAEVLLEPTLSTDLAESAMGNLPTGGRTPLAHAMQLAHQVLEQHKNQHKSKPLLIVLSDGKANVPLSGGGDPWQQTLRIASAIAQMGIQSLVLDTEKGYLRFGRAAELASALQAECLSVDDLNAESVTRTVNEKIQASNAIKS